MKRIIISGGGTGGHIFPAIAIADAIKRLAPDTEIMFVGAEGRMEMEKVPAAGYPIEGLWISGFQRRLTLDNLSFPFKVLHSMWKAGNIVKRFRPDAVVGVGGYASGPLVEAGARAGVRAIIQEQNSYAGVTNKILSRKASKICVAYEGMERFFEMSKLVFTGNPVRADIVKLATEQGLLQSLRGEAAKHYGLSADKPTLLVTGGSLGARTLNQAMANGLAEWSKRPELQVLWQCGKTQFESLKQLQLPENVKLTAFLDRMDLAYAIGDVVVARAGALTVSELCVLGKPCILIPSPNVAEDHQTANAMALVKKEAAIMVKDTEAAEKMLNEAFRLLGDNELQKKLSQNAKSLGITDSAERIAKIVLA